MVTHENRQGPLDEKGVLAELDRLREAIQAARRTHQHKSEEFDRFVQSWRKPSTTAPDPQTSSPSTADSTQTGGEPRSAPLAVQTDVGVTEDVPLPLLLHRSGHRQARRIWLLGGGAIVVVIALGALITRSGTRLLLPRSARPVPDLQASSAQARPPLTKASTPQPTPGVVLELRTVHPVWIRVVIDGQKTIERIFQTGERLHFSADRSIVVRVGDGGGVLVKTGDVEDRFGPLGQPLTRTFMQPPNEVTKRSP
jgi:uncharacterized protein DUF4115